MREINLEELSNLATLPGNEELVVFFHLRDDGDVADVVW